MTNKEAMQIIQEVFTKVEERIYRLFGIRHSLEYEKIKKMAINALEEQDKSIWIPVSEGLPPEHDAMFAKFKGTDKWNKAMFEKISDDVNVTVELEDGTGKTMTMHTTDGEWKESFHIVKKKVMAWMPLPDPYQGK